MAGGMLAQSAGLEEASKTGGVQVGRSHQSISVTYIIKYH
jgi:hypothetical protein